MQLELDTVVFVPAGVAPHRAIEQDPGPEARVAMCRQAISADERFRLSRAEVDREGPSYTADTLRAFDERSPGDRFVLILGGDQALALPEWHEPATVAGLATVIAVTERTGAERAAVEEAVARVPGALEKLRFFYMPRIDISASLVRSRAAAGLPVRYLVPDDVASYVEAHSLYAPVAVHGASA